MTPAALPVLTAQQLISALERMGFHHRPLSGGSHVRYVHPDGRRTTVPVHKGKDIGRGLLRKILRDIGLTSDELREYL